MEIPEGVEVKVENKLVIVKGPKGELKREFISPKVSIKTEGNQIILSTPLATKKEKRTMGTYKSHINNMLKGAKNSYIYKLKVCSSHFPMNVSIDGNKVIIKNYVGEKVPRKAKILEGVNVKIQGNDITVEGLDLEKVGQTAANIEESTKRRNFDTKIFADGCWIVSKKKLGE